MRTVCIKALTYLEELPRWRQYLASALRNDGPKRSEPDQCTATGNSAVTALVNAMSTPLAFPSPISTADLLKPEIHYLPCSPAAQSRVLFEGLRFDLQTRTRLVHNAYNPKVLVRVRLIGRIRCEK